MKQLLLTLSVLTFGLALSPLQAEKLDTRLISADASWVVHLNADQLKQGDLGGMIQNELTNGEMAKDLDGLSAILQFDFRKDMSSVTMFGSGAEDEAVIVANAKVNADHFTTLLRMNPDYKAHMHGDATIHEWVDENVKAMGADKKSYGAMLPGGQVIMAPKKEFVSQVIDQITGKVEGLAADSLLAQLLPSKETAFFVAAVQLDDIPDLGPEAEFLKIARSGSLSIAEVGTSLIAELNLMTDTEQNALSLSQMAQGMLAFAMMAGQEEPELARLAQATSIEHEGRKLSCSINLPTEEVVTAINAELGLNLGQ